MYYTQEQIDRANQADIVSFLQSQGEQLTRAGQEYRWKRHNSLTVRGNKWYRHSQSKGGGPVDFVMEFFGKSFTEAVELLTGEQGAAAPDRPSPAPLSDFRLPPRSPDNCIARNYLTAARRIDEDVSGYFFSTGDIYEEAAHHNAVFVGRDKDGVPRYAHQRSTAGNFRLDVKGSDKGFNFCYRGEGERLFVFEAPIDLLSFLCLFKKDWQKQSYLSLGGVGEKALLHFLSDRPNIQTVYLCLDSDEAGNDACSRLVKLIPEGYIVHRLMSVATPHTATSCIPNDRENWAIFENVHEPVVDRAIWEQVQEKRGKIRRRKPKDGERNMFCGLLVCANCGYNLNYHFNQGNHDIKYFNCSNYNSGRGSCTSTHYIRVDFLEQVVLGEIKRLTKYAIRYEDEFQQAIMGSTQKTVELERKLKQKELAAAQARDGELDGLFERIYEDNISGKLSDERFAKMSQRYEEEQAELSEKIKALRKELDKLSGDAVSTDMFLTTVRKYTRAKKLTPRMLNELVNHIEVHRAEKINGEWVQKLTIYYNCVGALFIPDTPSMPVPDVTVNTRRGVYVSYEPAQNGQ